jgi:hypothetical protein
MCAIEDAGWEIRDVMMWVYGSGFPKSHDISKAIDKAAIVKCPVCNGNGFTVSVEARDLVVQPGDREAVTKVAVETFECENCGGNGAIRGAERQFLGPSRYYSPGRTGVFRNDLGWSRGGCYINREGTPQERLAAKSITAPATEAAKLWDGWGTALKPAWEPVIVSMKPREGTFAANALKWGVAGLWVDGGRIGTSESLDGGAYATHKNKIGGIYGKLDYECGEYKQPQGRWPANFALVHHPECVRVGAKRVRGITGGTGETTQSIGGRGAYGGGDNRGFFNYADADGLETVEAWECHPECPVRMLGEQSGESSTKRIEKLCLDPVIRGHKWGTLQGNRGSRGHTDTGTAARFFYCAKASRSERIANGEVENHHPTVKPLGVLEYLCNSAATSTQNTWR